MKHLKLILTQEFKYMFNKAILFFILLCIFTIDTVWSQTVLSPIDSISLSSAKQDTILLRSLTLSRNGEAIAAKAQNKLASVYYNAKDEIKAQIEFLNVYNDYPLLPEAKKAALYLGKIAFHRNDFISSKKYLQEYLASNPTGKDEEWASYHLMKINSKNHDRDFISDAQSYINSKPNLTRKTSMLLYRDLIVNHFNRKSYRQTISAAEKFMSNYPNDSLYSFANYYLVKAKFILNDSSFVKDAKSFLTVNNLFIKKRNSEIQYDLMRHHLNNHDYVNGLNEAYVLLQYFPNDSLSDMTKCYIARTKYLTHDTDYTKCANDFLNINKKHLKKLKPVINAELIRHYTASGKMSNALTEAIKMTTLYPKDSLTTDVKFRIGELFSSLNRHNEAILYCNKMLDSLRKCNIDSLASRAQFLLASAYAANKEYTNARINFRKVITKYPNCIKWVNASEFSIALLAYREELNPKEINSISANPPEYDPAMHQKILGNKNKQNNIKGYKELNRFIAEHPFDLHTQHALMALADLESRSGNYKNSISLYDRLFCFDSVISILKKQGTVSLHALNDYRKMFLKAAELKAGLLLNKTGEVKEAMKIYDSLLAKTPDERTLKLQKVKCLIKLGNKESARTILQNLSSDDESQQGSVQYYLSLIK